MEVKLYKIVLLILFTTALAACGGGSGSGDDGISDNIVVNQPTAPRNIGIANDVDGNIIVGWFGNDWFEGQHQGYGISGDVQAKTYKVYWSTSGYLDLQQKRDSINVSTPRFVHRNLSFGTTYYYAITTIQNGVESDLSTSPVAAIAGAPSKPVNVSAVSVYSDINLAWDPELRADTYTVYWSNGLGESETIEFATSPFLHTGLVGVEYEYSVTASNEYGESMIVDVAASPDLVPATPIGLSVTSKSWLIKRGACTVLPQHCGTWLDHSDLGDKYGTQINVKWQDIGTGYKVYRVGYHSAYTSNSDYEKRFPNKPFTVSYCYYVIAYNRFGNSLPTDTVCTR